MPASATVAIASRAKMPYSLAAIESLGRLGIAPPDTMPMPDHRGEVVKAKFSPFLNAWKPSHAIERRGADGSDRADQHRRRFHLCVAAGSRAARPCARLLHARPAGPARRRR